MGTGYTRNDTVNNIADGNIINASDLDGEFDAVQAAFDAATGHTHDGTTGEGAPIEVTGPAQEYVSTGTEFRPKSNNTYDLGSSGNQWKDLYVDGTANLDAVDIDGGNIDGTVIGAATAAAGTFTTATATTGNITTVNATTVDTTNIEVTNIKAKDGTAAGSIANSTGVVTLSSSVLTTTDINGGTIDGATIATSDITVGTGKTLNVSSGTLTLANDQISGDKVEGGTINAITINTLDATTVNTTTVDATNVEVTNIKAKDGTASATIADSTGVMTIASSVLTTADINGGTIDGTVIGGSTPAAISGTTGTFSGNLTVDTDTLFVDAASNNVGIGTSSPQKSLVVSDGGAMGIELSPDDAGQGYSRILNFDRTTSQYEPLYIEAEDLRFSTGTSAVERMRIDSSGNVGIGATASDGYKLRVDGAGVPNGGDTSSLLSLRASTNSFLNFRAANEGGIAYQRIISTDGMQFWTNSTERMRITSTGSVGIGTSSPNARLHVAGGFQQVTNGSSSMFMGDGVSLVTGSSASASAVRFDGDALLFSYSATERMRITSAGSVGIGTSSPFNDTGYTAIDIRGSTGSQINFGTTAARYGQIVSNATNGLTFNTTAAIPMLFFTDGVERARIDASGNLLVGTTSAVYGGQLSIKSTGTVALSLQNSNFAPATSGTQVNTYFGSATGDTYAAIQVNDGGGVSFNDLALQPFGGSVGIGTTSPSTKLHIAAPANAGLLVSSVDGTTFQGIAYNSNDDQFTSGTLTNHPSVFFTNNTERARIDASGNLLVGTTSPAAIYGKLTVAGTGITIADDGQAKLQIGRYSAVVPNSYIKMGASSNSLRFSNPADTVDLMTLDASGNLLVGTTVAEGSARIAAVSSSASGAIACRNATGSGSTLISFINSNNTAFIGSITNSGNTGTAYNTTSDYRLKENVVPLAGAADRLSQIPVHRFNFIADPDKTVDGFLAHEVQAFVPEAVTGEKDAVDKDGKPVHQGIDQSKLVPLLTAALQEALQKIEALEARITAIEA